MAKTGYVLTTRRLGLRRYRASDATWLRDVFADPYAARFYPAMNQPANIEKWIAWNLRNYEEHGFGLWAVELLDDGRPIGDAGLTYQPVEGSRQLEIGYHIHTDLRRMGLASEASLACLDYAFTRSSADFVCSLPRRDNAASVTVARRLHAAERVLEGRELLLFYTTREQWLARGGRC